MKNWIQILLYSIIATLITLSCTDEEMVKTATEHDTYIKLSLVAPSTSSSRGLTTTQEDEIKNITVLVFATNDQLVACYENPVIQTNTDGLPEVTIKVNSSIETARCMILANIEDQENASAIQEVINALAVGSSTRNDVMNLLYTVAGKWNIESSKAFPMWGQTDITIVKGVANEGIVMMIRALARINVYVNNGAQLADDKFTLTSVRVYFSMTGGNFIPADNNMTSHVAKAPTIQSGKTSIRGKENPLEYKNAGRYKLENTIYIPESDNKVQTDKNKRVTLVIGGCYGAETVKETFYRMDFADQGEVIDVLRNHSYEMNITDVLQPGTETPEEALKDPHSLTFTITAWDDTKVAAGNLGIYELNVAESALVFGYDAYDNYKIPVSTNYSGGWNVETQPTADWITTAKDGDNLVLQVNINTTETYRTTSFTVKAGKLVKTIDITQMPNETANCYIANQGGTYKLKATVMGNGAYGANINGTNIYPGPNNGYYNSDGSINKNKIKQAKLIWQSQPNLITDVASTLDQNEFLAYTVNDQDNLSDRLGGNAVIGIYDNSNNIIWSWHIWVVYGYDAEGTLLHFMTKGIKSGYWLMDRNLGAMNNVRESVTSYGLTYQWGRKDPMRTAGTYLGTTPFTTYDINGNTNSWSFATGDISYSIKNPMTYVQNWQEKNKVDFSGALWGNPEGHNSNNSDPNKVYNEGKKSIYDPCPPGYKVPSINAYYFGESGGHSVCYHKNPLNNKSGANNGYTDITAGSGKYTGYLIYYFGSFPGYEEYSTWMPLAPYYNNTNALIALGYTGGEDMAFTWMNAADGINSSNAYPLIWHPVNNHIHNFAKDTQKMSYAGTIRCVRETDTDVVTYSVPEKIVLQPGNGNSMSFDVSTKLKWKIENSNLTYDWFTAQITGSSITITTKSANTSIEDRVGYIVIRFSNGEKAFVKVIQSGATSKLAITLDDLDMKSNKTSTLTMTGLPEGIEWTVSTQPAFVDVSPKSGTGNGRDVQITLTTNSENKADNSRSGTLKISFKDKKGKNAHKEVTVRQKGKKK